MLESASTESSAAKATASSEAASATEASHGELGLRLFAQVDEQACQSASALSPCGEVVSTKGLDAKSRSLWHVLHELEFACGDDAGTSLASRQQLVGNRIGSTYLEPAFHCVFLTGNELYEGGNNHSSFLHGCNIPCLLPVEVIACTAVFDVALRGEVEVGIRVVGDAVLEAYVRREIHIARIGNRRSVDDKTILECFEEIVSDHRAPNAIAVAFHHDIARQHLTLQLHLFGFGGFETEGNALFAILRRNDGTGEQTGHYAGCELLFLTCSSGCRLRSRHRIVGSLLVEE